MKRNNFLGVGFLLLLSACGGESYVPKPKTYPRVIYPEKQYISFQKANIPYYFEIPSYSQMTKDTNGVYTLQPYWFNLQFPQFNATLHLTYHEFQRFNTFDSLINDTRKLVKKHLQKAEDITEVRIADKDRQLTGVYFNIEGNTATNLNFYLTDSVQRFFRGALYFNQKTNQDSIAPVFQFIKKDVEHLIQTFHWNKH